MGQHPGAWTSLEWSVVVAEFTEGPVAGIDYPARLAELRAWFPTDADCLDYLDWLRWPDGFICPRCGGVRGRRGQDGLWRCRECWARTSVTSGTVFQDTRTPLTVWFEACWLMSVPKNGVSAMTLSRVLPIGSYQTAWTMLAKLRSAMSSVDKAKLSGVVEVDEWFHGGVVKGGNGLDGKHLVAAAVEHSAKGRGYGRVRLGVITNRTAWQLRKFVRATVEPGSYVITDGLSAYDRALAGYRHEARNESAPGADPAHELLPGVHRVFSLAERWLLGTRNRGMLFYRLLQHAVGAAPVTYDDLVRVGALAEPTPFRAGNVIMPGTLETGNSHRPWRQNHPTRTPQDSRQSPG
jgi:hypothetical protein